MNTIVLSNGVWSLELSNAGEFVALRTALTDIVPTSRGLPLGEVIVERARKRISLTSARLRHHDGRSAQFETTVDLGKRVTLRFDFQVAEPDGPGTAVTCRVALIPEAALDADVTLRWYWNARMRGTGATLFAPLFDGKGLRTSRTKRPGWHYACAGGGGEGERLALPLLDESGAGSPLHIAYFADPFFSTGFTLPADSTPEAFQCTFLCAAGPHQFPERTFGLYLHHGDADTALEGYFRHGVENCPPGPAWLHDIAMVHYDYLSEKGEGWFRDIDRLVELIPEHDRRRIVLTLHGWYDLLGRYVFDERLSKLDQRWVVMPKGEKREMTLEDMHRRIAYAKGRGFRVLLYYADGLAIDSGAPNYSEEVVFRNGDGTLRKHHWAGPDTLTQTYVMNPLHPRVQNFFRGYTNALLDEFGTEIDGLAWDETFTTRVGDISGGDYPGYADRAFMVLCRELRALVKARHPDMAFLASDCTGLRLPLEDGSYWGAYPAQNAIVFDGTYQDSQCYPTAWQFGLFPNYRNTLWSCNWKPVEHFERTVLGVIAFGVPVAISNGWGEDKGISRYSGKEIEQLLQLFEVRKNRTGRVRWIECYDR